MAVHSLVFLNDNFVHIIMLIKHPNRKVSLLGATSVMPCHLGFAHTLQILSWLSLPRAVLNDPSCAFHRVTWPWDFFGNSCLGFYSPFFHQSDLAFLIASSPSSKVAQVTSLYCWITLWSSLGKKRKAGLEIQNPTWQANVTGCTQGAPGSISLPKGL